jgi:phytoene dehydrogenase-like protein
MDAIVIGSGPNGLAAAIVLAREGLAVRVLEARDTPGGGVRTEERTLPGFLHDPCSAVHPLALVSPLFRTLPLERHGLVWVRPDVEAAHPLDGGRGGALVRDVEATAILLGGDGDAYRRRIGALARDADRLLPALLRPLASVPPRGGFGPLARFGLAGLRPAAGLARSWFAGDEARALFAGMAAHSILPLDRVATSAVALVLMLAGHGGGWPFPRGGARAIMDALVAHFRELGGQIECGHPVRSMRDLPEARAYLFDVAPRNLVAIAGERLSPGYRSRLARFRHGPGSFKIDWALDGPIPWSNAVCRQAGTVHVGGTLEEVAEAEAAPWRGDHAARPFVLVAQPTLFDRSRAPEGKHVGWGYCHVPHGSSEDRTEAVETQIERFAPGFRDLVLARAVHTAVDLESWNPNYVGGDIAGGVSDLGQLVRRPVFGPTPYATPDPTIWLCSASTPPGGGVHGMCGAHAADAVLGAVFGRRPEPRNHAESGAR